MSTNNTSSRPVVEMLDDDNVSFKRPSQAKEILRRLRKNKGAMVGLILLIFILLVVIFVVGCALTNFMSNTATTALMVPIATSLAESLGADPRSMIIATVIACSCAYATPIGMPANTMVVGLGGYKFKDYVKAGLPLIAVSFVVCIVLLPILFPFYG